MYKVKVTRRYFDTKENKHIDPNTELLVSKTRADELVNAGVGEMVKTEKIEKTEKKSAK